MTFLKLLLLVSVSTPVEAQSAITAKVQEALDLRLERLQNFSVDLETQLVMQMGERRKVESRESHFYGEEGQFRRDTSLAVRGLPGRRPEGPGLAGRFYPEILRRADLLSLPGFFEETKVIGPRQIEGLSLVEIEFRPKLQEVQIDRARLFADPESGMPIRIELTYGPGFISAELKRDLIWQEEQGITVAHRQVIEVSMGGGFGRGGFESRGPGRGGGRIEISTEWRDYRWDLSFAADFFDREEEFETSPRLSRRRPDPSERRPPDPSDTNEDPFEEIQILSPLDGRAGMNQVRAEQEEEILIEGGSVGGSLGPGRNESDIMRGILSGFGGRGGRGGGPSGGGLRGARIGGSRANRIQGSISAGFSSSALDAKPYSLDGKKTADPHYSSWNAGISIGGPLPGSSGDSSQRGRFFGPGGRSSFFVDFHLSRGDQLQSQYGRVPTQSERQGDFSETVYDSGPLAGTSVALSDPRTGVQIPDAVLPRIDPISAEMLRFFPLPNREDPVLNYFSQQILNNSRNRVNVRLMSGLSERFRLSGSYSQNDTAADRFNLFPEFLGHTDRRGQNFSLSLNYTVGPGLINNLRIQWNRNRNLALNPFSLERNISSELGIQNTSPSPIDYGLPTSQFTNFSSLDNGASSKTVREKNTIGDNFMWVKGAHFFRLGGDVSWNRWNQLGSPNGMGTLTFAGVATSLYRGETPIPGTGYDFADFLLGLAQGSRIQYGNSDNYLRRPEFALFLNDNWRMNSRATVQLGLRYQFLAPWLERYDRISNLDLGPEFSTAETVVPGSQGTYFGPFPRALVQSDWNNLAPRLALAYRLNSGTWASILRASYGVFFPNETYDYFASELTAQPPFGFSIQTTAQGTDFLPIDSAFSQELEAEVANTFAVDPHFRLSTIQNWDVSIQQSLPRGLFLSVGYAGSRGTGLEQLRAPNRILDGEQQTLDTAEYLFLSPGASSTYHGLQVMAMRRVRSGFTLNGTYEFGKSLDNASSLSGGQRIVAQNDADLASERSRSSFNNLHRFRLNWFFELPFGSRHRWFRDGGILNAALSNWFLTGTLTASSGRPFTARILGNQINNSGTSSQASERASVTGEPIDLPDSQRSTTGWFNTGAFRLPDPGSFGDAGRNTIDGPGSWVLNVNLARSIPLNSEGQRLLITMRASNVLNHVNYTGLNTTVNSTAFGRVVSVGEMRRIELSLRVMF